MATKDFLNTGINSITYKDGKQVNIASYVEMCLRTASHRATLLGEGKKRDEYGIYTVVVSAHANTCPMCAVWQGKVLIDDVFSNPTEEYLQENKGKYKLLSEAIDAGILHVNCKHTLTTYFPGITNLPTVPDEKKALERYKAEQEQRRLERYIRKWKRISIGSQDEANIEFASNKLLEYSSQLKTHLEKHPYLRRNRQKEKIYDINEAKNTNLLKNKEERVKIKRDGSTRAAEFSKYWEEASLKEAINKFTPEYEIIEKLDKGKILYNSKKTNIQIVYDTNGNYFRIEDLTLKGKRRYLDINGNNASNKIENGKQKGRSKEEYEALTHFKNKDGED